MKDENLDEKGYLKYSSDSSPLRIATAKALRHYDLHANSNSIPFNEDIIFGTNGLDRQNEVSIPYGYYDFTALALFLIKNDCLKIKVNDLEKKDFALVFHPHDLKTIKSRVKSITGPRFEKWAKKYCSLEHQMVSLPVTSPNNDYLFDENFNIPLNKEDVFILKISNGGNLYCLAGNDIIFPDLHSSQLSMNNNQA